jgi:hypothetical protein
MVDIHDVGYGSKRQTTNLSRTLHNAIHDTERETWRGGVSNQDSTGRGIMSQQTVINGSERELRAVLELGGRGQGLRFDIRCWL